MTDSGNGQDRPPADEVLDRLVPGWEFDGYRLERLVGAGGMGRVFLATDTLLDRPVAIKFLFPLHPDEAVRDRFLNEARTIARLHHPCIVTVHRAGEIDGRPYIVSEFVEGESLDRCSLPLPWQEVLPIAQDIARGLAAAHQLGIVHRDIKPANVMRTPEGAKLLDFGIARLAGASPGILGAGPIDGPPPGLRELPEASAGEEGPTRPVAVPRDQPQGALDLHLQAPREAMWTRPGRVMGTPAYMAPEVLSGHEATFASDVYSFGALLFTLLVGEPPPRPEGGKGLPPGTLARTVPGLPPGLAAVVERCLSPNPADRFLSANEVRGALNDLERTGPEGLVQDPYRGLRPFGTEHEGVFFGRDAEARAILQRLASDSLVVVTGDSGVGKSSLCRAGVLPKVPHLGQGVQWTVVLATPGPRPVRALASAIAQALPISEEAFQQAILEGPDTAGRLLRQVLGPARGLVWFLDQLEEVVTISDPEEAARVLALVQWFARAPAGLRLLATVRVDFLGRIAARLAESDLLVRHLYFVRPLSRERLREVVVRPAERLGVRFESEALVETLVEAAAQAEGGLPLLEFTLERLWDLRDRERGCITEEALRSLGGVAGALGRHGDEVIARLGPADREAARRVLMRLVTRNGTRAEVRREDLCGGDPRRERALEVLVQSRLVIARENPAEGMTCQIAHEALLQHWETLRRWVTARGEALPVQDRLGQAATDWQRLGRPGDLLWGRVLLDTANHLDPMDLSPVERDFLEASRRRWRRGRLLRFGAVVAVVLGLGATYGGVRLHAAHQLHVQVQARLGAGEARMQHYRQVRGVLAAREAEALTRFDEGDWDGGKDRWAEVLRWRVEAQEALVQAAREFETAVLLQPRNGTAVSWTARALYERAILAERQFDRRLFQEVVGRLALFDADGQWRRELDRPGRLRLDCRGIQDVVIEREHVQEEGPRTREVVFQGPCPEETSWPPGSYRVRLSAQGREDGVMPVLLRRGEEVRVEVPLLPKGSLPEGFVLVPGGWTLIGSPDEDSVRRGFFHASPMHETVVGPFLIAVHETTFGDYLQWLDSLPPGEREARLPRVETGGFEGALTLRQGAGGVWEIEIRPAGRLYRARAGEPIRYEARTARAEVDWLRMPVVGVTADQAREYARWLQWTGRVPGARLCREVEWERAARGADGRPYPHGWTLGPGEANYDETYGKRPEAMGPDEVGSHPESESPFGVQDMAGNVWEWTRSSSGRADHAARGGSFYFDVNSARTYNRETPEPSFRDVSVGFRLCADLPRL
ncbi:MAG TPA: SUMF1/EgtB/PvdO family nonheme iron enzyme [Myxococcota bacterium]|nr:SUMF1/EgtB/PvdO family nonheme iron enzyme [Myxococcota bacterium]HQK52110.1 SUMF1/EgtB/PvdO family nonheme iron enzyme [Myxococcota bacterium]